LAGDDAGCFRPINHVRVLLDKKTNILNGATMASKLKTLGRILGVNLLLLIFLLSFVEIGLALSDPRNDLPYEGFWRGIVSLGDIWSRITVTVFAIGNGPYRNRNSTTEFWCLVIR
jgi:hypothetical protein